METKNRYIAIGWFNRGAYNSTSVTENYYIVFDSLTSEVKIISDKALKLINNQLLNIDYDEYCNHLTTVKRFTSRGTGLNHKEIIVQHEIKREHGQLYTEVTIDNISNNKDTDCINIEKYLIVSGGNLTTLYSGYMVIGSIGDIPGQYKIKVMKKVGYDKEIREQNEQSFMFKRGFIKTNLNNDINQQLKQRENKLKILGKDTVNYEYIEDNGVWLICTDLGQSDVIQIPRCMNYISYNFTNTLLKELSKTRRKLIVCVTESQMQSIEYNIGIMPEMCRFGKKLITKSEIIRQFKSAVENERLVVKLK